MILSSVICNSIFIHSPMSPALQEPIMNAQATPKQRVILWLACSAVFFEAFDVSIVNLALPVISGDLHISIATAQWVQTLYLLSFGGFLLLGGRLADYAGMIGGFLTVDDLKPAKGDTVTRYDRAELLRRQVAAGAIGICCATLGEAEVLASGGIENILITSPVVTPAMIICSRRKTRRSSSLISSPFRCRRSPRARSENWSLTSPH